MEGRIHKWGMVKDYPRMRARPERPEIEWVDSRSIRGRLPIAGAIPRKNPGAQDAPPGAIP